VVIANDLELTVVEATVWDITVLETTILDPEYDQMVKIVDRGGEFKDLQLPEGDISAGVQVLMGVYSRWTLFIGIHQQGVLTFAGIPANADTVVIGGKTYTFQTVLTNADGNVLIGADQDAALTNLTAAINLTTGAGTLYAAATVINPDVKAVANLTANTLTAIAKLAGANTTTTTETGANLSWDGITLDAVANPINITMELSPDAVVGVGVGQTFYTIPESPIIFTDAGEDALEFGYDATNIRITGSNAVHVSAQVRGSF
jgi:hypothetical protein